MTCRFFDQLVGKKIDIRYLDREAGVNDQGARLRSRVGHAACADLEIAA